MAKVQNWLNSASCSNMRWASAIDLVMAFASLSLRAAFKVWMSEPVGSWRINWAIPRFPARAVRPAFCNSTRLLSGKKVMATYIPPWASTPSKVVMSVPRPAILVAMMISPESIWSLVNASCPV